MRAANGPGTSACDVFRGAGICIPKHSPFRYSRLVEEAPGPPFLPVGVPEGPKLGRICGALAPCEHPTVANSDTEVLVLGIMLLTASLGARRLRSLPATTSNASLLSLVLPVITEQLPPLRGVNPAVSGVKFDFVPALVHPLLHVSFS